MSAPSDNPRQPLPPDVLELFVAALADALVADIQPELDAMVASRRGSDHQADVVQEAA